MSFHWFSNMFLLGIFKKKKKKVWQHDAEYDLVPSESMNKSCLKNYFQMLMNCIKVVKGETWLADTFPNMNILAYTPGKNYVECFCKFSSMMNFLKCNLGPKGPNFPVNWNTNEICHSIIEVHNDMWRTVSIHHTYTFVWQPVDCWAYTVVTH